ncbi:MAG: hypothetical protein WAU36_06780 [Cyclobacteriaceae bacterium]
MNRSGKNLIEEGNGYYTCYDREDGALTKMVLDGRLDGDLVDYERSTFESRAERFYVSDFDQELMDNKKVEMKDAISKDKTLQAQFDYEVSSNMNGIKQQ